MPLKYNFFLTSQMTKISIFAVVTEKSHIFAPQIKLHKLIIKNKKVGISMQNKGFIRVLAVLLTLVCLFYISFSFETRYYNKKAEEISNGDPVVYKNYLDSMATEKVYLG